MEKLQVFAGISIQLYTHTVKISSLLQTQVSRNIAFMFLRTLVLRNLSD